MEGSAVAAPPRAIEEPDAHNRHLSYTRTEAGLPPVAIVDRSPIETRHKIIFGVITYSVRRPGRPSRVGAQGNSR
jgi:hypothetical protein